MTALDAFEPTDPTEPPVTRVRGPGDLVGAVPALLGFHPARSLVAVVLRPPANRLALTVRADLPAHTDTDGWDAVAAMVARGAAQAHGRSAVLVVYTDVARLARAAERAVAPALRRAGVEVTDVLRVHDGRYYGVTCRDPRCCPPRGRPVPTGALQARLAMEGRRVLPTREHLAAEIDGPPGDEAAVARARRHLQAGAVTPQTMDVALREGLSRVAEGALPGDLAARLAVLLGDGDCRDEAYRHLVRGPVRDHRALWAAVCRAVSGPEAVVPHALFALAAYLDGDGAVANVAWERAAGWDHGHATVLLVGDIMAGAVPPATVIEALTYAVGEDR